SPLAGPLKARTGATIYGCAVAEIPVDDSGVRMEAGADFGFSPDVSLCGGGQVLEGPGWTLEAIATPGHTSNHICFALKEENALFSGDHIMGWSTTVITPPDGDMTDYMDSLDLVKARDFSILWPTHGPPVTEVAPFIDAYIAHRRAREAQVLKAVTEGHGRIREMVPVLYADVDPRLHPAAARSVLGHMIDLVKRGLVTTDGKPGPDSDYRRA
ncbi:MAG TPA: MBL fold metallo-hydrolase, partial [Phenylobacterium sp.]|nr:MBL fold metallo-hydrolase [Phenylobacterium sp.]